jgi:hypothetical protein
LNSIFKRQNLVFKSEENLNASPFEVKRSGGKIFFYPEKVNFFLISQFSENQFGLSEEERNGLSLFHNNDFRLLSIFKKGKNEVSLKDLKLRIIEYTTNFMYNWKQMNFMSCEDMQYFLRRLQPYFYFKIDKATNKLSFEKSSAYEFTVDPLNCESIRNDELKVSRVSIEFYHWDSNIDEDNEMKKKYFNQYREYSKAYELKNKMSYIP